MDLVRNYVAWIDIQNRSKIKEKRKNPDFIFHFSSNEADLIQYQYCVISYVCVTMMSAEMTSHDSCLASLLAGCKLKNRFHEQRCVFTKENRDTTLSSTGANELFRTCPLCVHYKMPTCSV